MTSDKINERAKPSVCPQCGSEKVRYIVYGLPDKPDPTPPDERDYVLGGCCVDRDSPNRYCKSCGHCWHIQVIETRSWEEIAPERYLEKLAAAKMLWKREREQAYKEGLEAGGEEEAERRKRKFEELNPLPDYARDFDDEK